MERTELARIVARNSKLPIKKAEKLIFALGDVIKGDLKKGNKVVYSNFGTFYTVHYPSKVITHPKLGAAKKMIMLPTNVAKWMPSDNIKKMVQNGETKAGVTAHGGKKRKQAENHADYGQIIKVKTSKKDEIREIPVAIKEAESAPLNSGHVNIYEEFIHGGGKEEATFDGVIRVHKKPVWRKIGDIFGAEKSEETASEAPEPKLPAKNTNFNTKNLAKLAGDNTPAARIVDFIIRRALRDSASDIHFDPSPEASILRFRIDGVLIPKASLPSKLHPAITARLKMLAHLPLEEHEIPQRGTLSLKTVSDEHSFTISTLPAANGERILIKIAQPISTLKSLTDLGLSESGQAIIDRILAKPHGLFLIIGPEHSGKTSTAYAVLDRISGHHLNIITLEDQIKYHLPSVTQSQINQSKNYHFASGLGAILEHQPDVLFVSDIPDEETAKLVVSASQRVILIATLNMRKPDEIYSYFEKLGINPESLKSILSGYICQRLVHRLCPYCKTRRPITKDDQTLAVIAKHLEEKDQEIAAEIKFTYSPEGCPKCSELGYLGRIGLFETKNSQPNGSHQTLAVDGLIKSKEGQITLEEIKRVL